MRGKWLSIVLIMCVVSVATRPVQAGWPHCGSYRGFHHYRSYSSWGPACFPTFSTYSFGFPACYPVAPCAPPPCYAYPYTYSYSGPQEIIYNPRSNFLQYNLPAIVAPAELSYGPQAVRQFLGLDRNFAQGPPPAANPPVAAAPAAGFGQGPAAAPAARPDRIAAVKFSNNRARELANQFIQIGDTHFQQQRFQNALQRYKTAAINAADLPEVFFRQGHAYVAVNQFELAARAFKRALALKPAGDRDAFQLDDLYADNRIAKNAHLETLAQRALANPADADAFFLIGVFLHYDQQAERAAKFFQQAQNLAAGNDQHLRGFLPQPPAPIDNAADVDQFAGNLTP